MSKSSRALAATPLVAALACSSVSTQVQADNLNDFKRYRSYAWLSQALASDRAPVAPEQVRSWIVVAIDQGLAGKGPAVNKMLERYPPASL